MTEHRRHYRSEGLTLAIRAQWEQASSPVQFRWEEKGTPVADWGPTPWQVAYFRHRPEVAFEIIRCWGG